MAQDRHSRADNHIVFEDARPGHTRKAGHHTALANTDVVGNEAMVVDNRPCADDGIRTRTTVDGSISSDFHIIPEDNPAELRDPLMQPITVAMLTQGPAEATLADTRAGFNVRTVANKRVRQTGAGADDAIAPQTNVFANAHMGLQHAPRADLGACANMNEGANIYACA